jgi:hypothetical protein
VAAFDTEQFLGGIVPLGEIRTGTQGRLIILGGFGHSASPTNVEDRQSIEARVAQLA